MLNGRLQLLDILSPPLAEGRLGLSIALLALLRSSIDLHEFLCQYDDDDELRGRQTIRGPIGRAAGRGGDRWRSMQFVLRTGFLPPFLFCVWTTSWARASTSASGVETAELTEGSRGGSLLGTTDSMSESLLLESLASSMETIAESRGQTRPDARARASDSDPESITAGKQTQKARGCAEARNEEDGGSESGEEQETR